MLACVVLAGCGGKTSLTAFIPPDTIALAGVHVDQIRATPLYRDLAARNRLPGFNAFSTETGVDPNRDISDLLLASDGINMLAIARGTFHKQPAGSPNGTIAFIGTDIALGGSEAAVHAAIDRYKHGHGGAPRSLMARVETLPPDAQIWVVVAGWRGLPADQLREAGNLANLDRILRSVESAQLTVDLHTNVRAQFSGACRSETDAMNLADTFRGFDTMAKMSARRHPDLLDGLDRIQIRQDGRVVVVSVDTPAQLVEKLLK